MNYEGKKTVYYDLTGRYTGKSGITLHSRKRDINEFSALKFEHVINRYEWNPLLALFFVVRRTLKQNFRVSSDVFHYVEKRALG